jgi:hypothetical protein
MPDRAELEARVNKEWSWAMAQVRAHPKTATSVMLAVGFVLGWLVHGWLP